jgi:transposase InsO family protein
VPRVRLPSARLLRHRPATEIGAGHLRSISENGPQLIARDFKEFIRIAGMTHVRTAPYYPQSNGKLERWHQSLNSECIRPGTPLTPEDARRQRKLRRQQRAWDSRLQ